MTYMGDPPATKHLKQMRDERTKQPVLQLAETPEKGSYQHGMDFDEGTGEWRVWMSPPDSDQWHRVGSYKSLRDATRIQMMLRQGMMGR